MKTSADLHTAVFHTLDEQIAIIDSAGNILEVNRAWQEFGAENGLSPRYACMGHNYLQTLSDSSEAGDSLASQALRGIADVLAGAHEVFYFEYPCHSPKEKRWFTMRMAPLHGDASRSLFVVSHHNVTQRKLAELRVEELAMQDTLTGLANRRAFHHFLSRELRSCMRNRTHISLVLIDVDFFKQYNDTFGHAAGDECLSQVGRVLLAHARRPGDLAARIGGDEFAMILGNTPLDNALEIAESALRTINELKLSFGDSEKVTASIGVVSQVPLENHSEDFLFQEADKALYSAKAAGRNRVAHI